LAPSSWGATSERGDGYKLPVEVAREGVDGETLFDVFFEKPAPLGSDFLVFRNRCLEALARVVLRDAMTYVPESA
jgi:hypothetical protein